MATIELLETVDDELTAHGVNMVKTSDLVVAEEYGVDEVIPEIVYFENGIPSLYPGKEYNIDDFVLKPNRKILFRLVHKTENDVYFNLLRLS